MQWMVLQIREGKNFIILGIVGGTDERDAMAYANAQWPHHKGNMKVVQN
jgi:hypothetical protein